MYPTRLNFMAPEKRKHIDRMLYIQFTKTTLETFLVTICLIAIVLLGGLWVLQQHFNDLVEQLTRLNNQQVQKNATIKEINGTLREVERIQSEYVQWTDRLIDLAAKTPNSITLQGVTMDIPSRTYTISGLAPTRNDLLNFQHELESLPYILQVDVPLSQLTEKINIRFSIQAVLKEQKSI